MVFEGEVYNSTIILGDVNMTFLGNYWTTRQNNLVNQTKQKQKQILRFGQYYFLDQFDILKRTPTKQRVHPRP